MYEEEKEETLDADGRLVFEAARTWERLSEIRAKCSDKLPEYRAAMLRAKLKIERYM